MEASVLIMEFFDTIMHLFFDLSRTPTLFPQTACTLLIFRIETISQYRIRHLAYLRDVHECFKKSNLCICFVI